MQDIKWDDISVFLAIHRAGSLSGAAELLGVNPSTVHRRLGELEAGLGTRLFDRRSTGLAPTPSGEALLPLAERVEGDMRSLVRRIAGRDQAPTGKVHLTAPEALLPLVVQPLASFREAFPQIDLRASFADRFFDLSRGEADVALRPSLRPPDDAVGRRIADIAWAVYASQDGPLPWATYTQDLDRLAASAWWRTHHADDPVLLSVNSVTAMHTVVACAPCKGLLPCFVGDPDPTLRRLTEPIPQAGSALWLLLHPDLRRTARVRALVDHLWGALRAVGGVFAGR